MQKRTRCCCLGPSKTGCPSPTLSHSTCQEQDEQRTRCCRPAPSRAGCPSPTLSNTPHAQGRTNNAPGAATRPRAEQDAPKPNSVPHTTMWGFACHAKGGTSYAPGAAAWPRAEQDALGRPIRRGWYRHAQPAALLRDLAVVALQEWKGGDSGGEAPRCALCIVQPNACTCSRPASALQTETLTAPSQSLPLILATYPVHSHHAPLECRAAGPQSCARGPAPAGRPHWRSPAPSRSPRSLSRWHQPAQEG